MPTVPGVRIASREYAKPFYGLGNYNMAVGPLHRAGERGYPEVLFEHGVVHITDELGDLRHGLPTRAFAVPLRVVLEQDAVNREIKLVCTLRGKNLRRPVIGTLTIIVAPPGGPLLRAHKESYC